jgi:hypothetical protein
MNRLIKTISITSYNRPKILEKCLKQLRKCQLIDEYKIVIVQQDYNSVFKKIINKFKFKNLHIIKTSYPKKWNPYKKMTMNGLRGFNYCFEKLNSDISFYLEDDIIVANDFLIFSEYILNKYKDDVNFFAVNGFSKEPFNIKKINLYSKFVFGIGKGWAINKKKWKTIKKFWNNKFINSSHPEYDYPIENFVKRNNYYVVMPFCSRTYELRSQGVSVKKSDNKYFTNLKKSFVKIKNNNFNFRYSFFLKYTWRQDCKKYKGYLIGSLQIKLKKLFKNIVRSIK